MMPQEIFSAGDNDLIWLVKRIFVVEPKANGENDRTLIATSAGIYSPVRAIFRLQKPAKVLLSHEVVSDSSKSLPVFFGKVVKDWTQAYLEMLEEHVLLSVTESSRVGDAFMQKEAASLTSKATQQGSKKHLKRFCEKNTWLPISPDLSLMDFARLSTLESNLWSVTNSSTTALN